MLSLSKSMPAGGYFENNFDTKLSAEDIIFAYLFFERARFIVTRPQFRFLFRSFRQSCSALRILYVGLGPI